MKQTHKIAYDYCMAMITQRAGEERVSQAFADLGSDNSIFGLAEPIEGAYTELVAELIGPELFDWLMWWMWECDMGMKPLPFNINGTDYDPSQMTLYKFLELVDENN
jgi:hypothetical protein